MVPSDSTSFISIAAAEVVAQSIRFRQPERAKGREPIIELSQRGGIEAIETPRTVDPDAHKPRLSQHFEMLGDVGLRQVEPFHQRAGGLFAIAEQGENVATNGIGYGGKSWHSIICMQWNIPVKEYWWTMGKAAQNSRFRHVWELRSRAQPVCVAAGASSVGTRHCSLRGARSRSKGL